MRRTELKRYTALRTHKVGHAPKELARSTLKPGTKRMKQGHSTPDATQAQAARWALMRKTGCICCLMNFLLGFKKTGMELEHHHLMSAGRRRGHDETIELCRHHHQGDKFPLVQVGYKVNALVYGPSYGKERKRFAVVYGTDDELLEFQNELLARVRAELIGRCS